MARRLVLAVSLLAAVIGVGWYLEHDSANEARRAAADAEARHLIGKGARLVRLTLTRAGETPLMLERARGQRWLASSRVGRTWSWPADVPAVEAIIEVLGRCQVEQWLDAQAGAAVPPLHDLGLAPPLVTLEHVDDRGRRRQLAIGMMTLDGGHAYVLADERLGVVSSDIVRVAGRAASEYLTHQLVELPWNGLHELEVSRPAAPGVSARLLCTRSASGFDVSAPADSAAVPGNSAWLGGLASRLERLEAQRLVTVAPAPAELRAAGLAPAHVSLTLRAEVGPDVAILLGGDGPDEGTAFARVGEGPLALVPVALRADLLRNDDSYRAAIPR